MANIQQAAKWMQEGKRVRREEWQGGASLMLDAGGFVVWTRTGTEFLVQLHNLLATDWEIAQ